MPSNYPNILDTNQNLYLVHDALRVVLADDYTPGDTTITVSDPHGVITRFPPTGIITLTEQCSDISVRAISFTYSGVDTTNLIFQNLVLLSGFTDVSKPKRLTDVTLNVVADHHNSLKDALIAIEEFAGKQGEVGTLPLQGTMEQRINFLRQLVLPPTAWFGVDKTIDVVPFIANFEDLSLRAPNIFHWDFGDGNTADLSFPYTPGAAEGTLSTPPPNGNVSHTYAVPGEYNVTLTVTNPFGTNTLTIPGFVTARTFAPDPATISFIPSVAQTVNGNVIRSAINSLIEIEVATNGEQVMDPILSYNWSIADDLNHGNASTTEAMFSVGGLYDIDLRTNTTLGAYRITEFPQVLDILENVNMWHLIFDPLGSGITQNLFTYEFGLLSETYKIKTYNPLSVSRNPAFLNGLPQQAQQTREFLRNNGFVSRGTTSSGGQGTAIIYWSEGAPDTLSNQDIRFTEYSGFDDSYFVPTIGLDSGIMYRTWNWVSLNAPQTIYFLFGTAQNTPTAQTNNMLTAVDLASLSTSGDLLLAHNFENGAEELLANVGDGTDGEFSVYRSAWKDSTGYIVRNDGTGLFFRLKSFYRTEGTISNQIQMIRKLMDIPGPTKLEGELVPLSNGLYFFNNSGDVSVYSDASNTWMSGGPGLNSPTFTSLQDRSVPGFDNTANTLVASSDGDSTAFLSFDYSTKAFIKFSAGDLTFSLLPSRPSGEQFGIGVY